jgi:hypothetical protein
LQKKLGKIIKGNGVVGVDTMEGFLTKIIARNNIETTSPNWLAPKVQLNLKDAANSLFGNGVTKQGAVLAKYKGYVDKWGAGDGG